MPELPEVEGYRKYIDSTALHQKITSFDCRDQRLLKKPLADFEQFLVGQEWTETERIGKYLFIKTNGTKILIMHFGMTGRPNYYKSEEDRPKYGHIQIGFANGYHFAFECRRKLGWWDLTDSIADYKSAHQLSDDARDLSLEDFKSSLKTRSSAIKSVLLDQSVAAGVGNWMADEILYQSHIDPRSRVNKLNDSQIEGIFKAMKKVIETALKHEAHYSDFPQDFLIHNRKEGATAPHKQDTIEKITVGGRSTYFSPHQQKLIK